MHDSQKAARIEALTRLAIATREKVDRAAYVLFVENTADVELKVFVEACRRLEHSAQWFPKVSELRDECRVVAARHRERKEASRRQLTDGPPITDEQWAEIRAKFQDVLARKGMR